VFSVSRSSPRWWRLPANKTPRTPTGRLCGGQTMRDYRTSTRPRTPASEPALSSAGYWKLILALHAHYEQLPRHYTHQSRQSQDFPIRPPATIPSSPSLALFCSFPRPSSTSRLSHPEADLHLSLADTSAAASLISDHHPGACVIIPIRALKVPPTNLTNRLIC
jgi:hypothetical protein